jgi:polyisoprenoid-binding protein YceI
VTSNATTTPTLADLAGTWVIDPTHSRIGFVARHAMVTKVRGAFNEFEGSATVDANDFAKSTATLVIKTVSIDARNGQRDGHLRSGDFLNVEDYPEITFASTRVTQTSTTSLDLTGDLHQGRHPSRHCPVRL